MARHQTAPLRPIEVEEVEALPRVASWPDPYARTVRLDDAFEWTQWHGAEGRYDLWHGAKVGVYAVAARVQAFAEVAHQTPDIARELLKEELRAELHDWIEEAVERRIAHLRDELGVSPVPAEPDPVAAWMAGNPGELEKYRGMMIAVHATKGVVAHGPDLKGVHATVRDLGLLGEVVFDAVPNI